MRARSASGAEPELVGEPGPEALQEDVGAVHEPQQRLAPARVAERERERALAGVGGEEHRPLAVPERRPPGAAVVARVGPLDLDHVGAERREDLRAVRAGDRRRDVEHAHAAERGQASSRAIIAASALCEDAVVFNQMVDWVSGSNWSYLAIFGVAVLDAFFPLVPSESMVIIAGALAGPGDLNVFLVILAAWAGAVVGDNISYGIGKWAGRAHREAALPEREGAPGVRLGRAAARGTRQLHHPRSRASSRSAALPSRSRPATRRACRGTGSSATTSSPAGSGPPTRRCSATSAASSSRSSRGRASLVGLGDRVLGRVR